MHSCLKNRAGFGSLLRNIEHFHVSLLDLHKCRGHLLSIQMRCQQRSLYLHASVELTFLKLFVRIPRLAHGLETQDSYVLVFLSVEESKKCDMCILHDLIFKPEKTENFTLKPLPDIFFMQFDDSLIAPSKAEKFNNWLT